MDPTPTQLAVMKDRYVVDGDHWLWPGPFDGRQPAYGSRRWSVRRALRADLLGPVSVHVIVTTTCDRWNCVNPAHTAEIERESPASGGSGLVRTPMIERLLRCMRVEGDCWVYPRRQITDEAGSSRSARRVAATWWRERNDVSQRMTVTCGNDLCINPDHLTGPGVEPPPPVVYPSSPIVCPADHYMLGDNLFYRRNEEGLRVRACRECQADYDQHLLDVELMMDPRAKLRAKFLATRGA